MKPFIPPRNPKFYLKEELKIEDSNPDESILKDNNSHKSLLMKQIDQALPLKKIKYNQEAHDNFI